LLSTSPAALCSLGSRSTPSPRPDVPRPPIDHTSLRGYRERARTPPKQHFFAMKRHVPGVERLGTPEHSTTETAEVQGGRERQPWARRDLGRRLAHLSRHSEPSAPPLGTSGQAGSPCVARPPVPRAHSQQSQSGAPSTTTSSWRSASAVRLPWRALQNFASGALTHGDLRRSRRRSRRQSR
jgi:hypothetical protein